MPSLHRNALPAWAISLIDRTELALIAAMAILLPFDHWFFGHLVNPAPMRVLGFVLTGVWLVQCAIQRPGLQLQKWHALMLVFLATCFYSAFFSPDIPNPKINSMTYKLIAASKIVAAMLFFTLACHMLTRAKLLLFLRIHLFNGTVICCASLILYFLHLYAIWPYNFALWVEEDIYNFVRIQGVSFEPQRFGAYMLTLLPFFLSRDLRKEIGWPCSHIDPFILVVMLATTFLSYAISTYLVLPVMLLLLFGRSRLQMRKLAWIFVGFAAMTAILLSIPAVRDATFEIVTVKLRGQSVTTRLHNWDVALREFQVLPWVGVGPESYSYFYGFFDTRVRSATPASHPPHSLFFGLLANQGLPGVLAFFGMMAAFGIALMRRLAAMPPGNNLAYTLAVIALVHFLVQFTIWLPWSLNQWLYMAMAWSASQVSSSTTVYRHAGA